jgi:hypothetical protein
MSNTISKEDLEFLEQIRESEPEFVRQYLGVEQMEETTDLLGTSDCADFLGVCKRSVLNYIKDGKLAATQEYGLWKIRQEDLLRFSKKREQEQNQGDDDMSQSKTRSPNRNPNIIKFLREWPLAKTPLFTLQEITKDYNNQFGDNMTENQMSSLLSNLKKKGVTVAKGRAAYSVCGTFFPQENAACHSVPVPIEDEEVIESPESCLTEDQRAAWAVKLYGKEIREQVMKKKIENMKKPERRAVDKFIEERFKGYEDLVFSTKDVAKAIPDMDRYLLSKALQNMRSTGQLEKGDELGSYIKKATIKKVVEVPPAPKSSSSYFDKIDEIRKSNMSEQLKEELVRKLA